MGLLRRLWRDDRAEVSSLATILLYTIIGLGVTVGVVSLRDQIVKEYGDAAAALEHLDQSFTLPNGDSFADDVNDPDTHFQDPTPPANQYPAGLDLQRTPGAEGDAIAPL